MANEDQEDLGVEFFEGTSRWLSGTITDPDGVGFKPEEVRLRLLDVETREVINDRDDDDVTTSVADDGTFSILLGRDDNAVIGPRTGKAREQHAARLTWDWGSGELTGKREFLFHVAYDAPAVA